MERLIDVHWARQVFPPTAGWRVDDLGTQRFHPLPWNRLRKVPADLRDPAVKDKFKNLILGTSLENWWLQACSDSEDTIFCLRFSKGRWNLPWELLITQLEYSPKKRASACFIRALEVDLPVAPRVFHERMRILVLQGDDGAFMKRRLDLAKEVATVKDAFESLENAVKEAVDPPVICTVTIENLKSLLSIHKPHILWFSGHGRSKPTSGLLFANRTWIAASDFAKQIKDSGHTPLYTVLSACDTAGATDPDREAPSPPALFEALRGVGITALLAMQAPIRDVSARAMAGDLFRSLAIGLPLEVATARARASQFNRRLDYAYPLDWACPVVWSAGQSSDRLEWHAATKLNAKLQLFGRLLIRVRLAPGGELESPITAAEREQARVWSAQARVWVTGEANGQHNFQWARVLRGMQLETKSWVIAVDFRDADPVAAIQGWAEAVFSELLPGEVPPEIALAISEMRRTPSSGWQRLCHYSTFTLALSGFIPSENVEWIWAPLDSNQSSPHVLVLSDKALDEQILQAWTVDSLARYMSEEGTATAISEAPDLAHALAVLNSPLQSHRIKITAPGVNGARSLDEWATASQLLVSTPAGPLITATARHMILATASITDRQKAHRHCVEMLGDPTLTLSSTIREQRLVHLLGAGGFSELAIEEATSLCSIYRRENRPIALLNVVQRLGALKVQLPSASKLNIAWAHLRLGRIDQAKFWLRHAAVLALPLEAAEKYGLNAEIQKSIGSPGSKEAALAEIEAAIRVCAKAMAKGNSNSRDARRMERVYRQDHARILQYLFYDRANAAAEYEQLLVEWANEPEADLDRAVVQRNLAECLRNMPNGAKHAQRILDLLSEALEALRRHPEVPLRAELLYEMSKTIDTSGDLPRSLRLLEECRDVAVRTGHHLVFAIADNRHFWHNESFDEKRWENIKTLLTSFSPHGWPLRACIDGRLKAARYFESIERIDRAYSELAENADSLLRNPSFNAGSDRFRIAATAAGLDILKSKLGQQSQAWEEFLTKYDWSAAWLATREGRTPQQIWSEV